MDRRLGFALSLVAGTAAAKPPVVTRPPVVPRATSVEVKVAEIAGTLAYIQPGEKAGVRRTAVVTINGKEHKIIESSDSFAVIALEGGPVREKDKGRATIVEEQEVKPPPPPHALSTWANGWTEEQPPAALQTPQFVPLGEASRSRRYDATLAFTAGGLIPLSNQQGSSIGYVQLDAKVHAEPFSVPAALDFDGSVRFYAAADLSSRFGGDARSYLLVRQLLLSYGSVSSWYAGIGRMKYAATTLGTLDGLRVQAPLGEGVTLSAFGGLLPNPLGGELAVDAQRFGVEARFYRPDWKLRPEAALVLHGSMFNGSPDERRASAVFAIYPGHSRLGAHVEVSNFDANNPWKVNPVEITGAGIDESVRVGIFDVGARVDLLEPERSRWLASYLPAAWFCRTVPSAGTPIASEACDGGSSMRALGSMNISVASGIASLTLGANVMGDISHGTEPHVLGAFLAGRLVRIAKHLRFELSANYSDATYVDMFGGTAGVGVTLFNDAVDVSAYYRRAELRYASQDAFFEQNGIGGVMVLFPTSTTMLAVQSEAIVGNDVNALSIIGTLVWRPRL